MICGLPISLLQARPITFYPLRSRTIIYGHINYHILSSLWTQIQYMLTTFFPNLPTVNRDRMWQALEAFSMWLIKSNWYYLAYADQHCLCEQITRENQPRH